MERRPLGTSGVEVPVVGMGTWRTFDVRAEEEVARCRAVLDEAYAAGATLFDTSPMYGASERVLSETMRGRRDDALVADKLWTPDDDEAERQAQRALRWYGDRVDVYQVHNLVRTRRRLSLLQHLRGEGKVRVIGATHYQHSAFPELLGLMRLGQIDQIQIPYNARDRLAERCRLSGAESHRRMFQDQQRRPERHRSSQMRARPRRGVEAGDRPFEQCLIDACLSGQRDDLCRHRG